MNATLSSRHQQVACVWCGTLMALHHQSFPSFFKLRGFHRTNQNTLQVSLPGQTSALQMLLPKRGSALKILGSDVVAISCSPACQAALEQNWSGVNN